jgi:hypothetical protein
MATSSPSPSEPDNEIQPLVALKRRIAALVTNLDGFGLTSSKESLHVRSSSSQTREGSVAYLEGWHL